MKAFGFLMLVAGAGMVGWYLSEPGGALRTVAGAPPQETVVASARTRPGEITVSTQRIGYQHRVGGVVVGPGGSPVPVDFVIDTGASTVVLPTSMIDRLGIDRGQLRESRAQTARGMVGILTGRLDTVEIGGPRNPVIAWDVEVAFVEDRYLGGTALLGMSFLGRYTVTIDDTNATMILVERY